MMFIGIGLSLMMVIAVNIYLKNKSIEKVETQSAKPPEPPTPPKKIFMELKDRKCILMGNIAIIKVSDKEWNTLVKQYPSRVILQDIKFLVDQDDKIK